MHADKARRAPIRTFKDHWIKLLQLNELQVWLPIVYHMGCAEMPKIRHLTTAVTGRP